MLKPSPDTRLQARAPGCVIMRRFSGIQVGRAEKLLKGGLIFSDLTFTLFFVCRVLNENDPNSRRFWHLDFDPDLSPHVFQH
jgi:hypothetical protein